MYIVFVLIMMRVYTLPLFAFRSMYYSARSFRKALKDVINSRRAIHHLNNSFPDATSEELTEADNVCIICREEMQSGKSLCTWILHYKKINYIIDFFICKLLQEKRVATREAQCDQ